MNHEWRRGPLRISTDPTLLDHELIHRFLSSSYWAKDIPAETVRRSIENSIPFGVFDGDRQVGFARVVTDRATFAYLGDVFVVEEYRGRGLSKWLMEALVSHPDLQGMRRWVLLTRDAHGLYRQFGFTEIQKPDRYMEKWDPDIYRKP